MSTLLDNNQTGATAKEKQVLHYTRINGDQYCNPRYLVECPKSLTLTEAKLVFGARLATDKQMISIQNTNGDRINLWLIIKTYENISDYLAKINY